MIYESDLPVDRGYAWVILFGKLYTLIYWCWLTERDYYSCDYIPNRISGVMVACSHRVR
jgi:hypothetical protein